LRFTAAVVGLIARLRTTEISLLIEPSSLDTVGKEQRAEKYSAERVIHFATYGTAGTKYYDNAVRLSKEANQTGWFETITV
jgi:hypothetical protein